MATKANRLVEESRIVEIKLKGRKMKFYKYQGTGNDFVMIDNRNGEFDRANTALVKKHCDRRFGIGADGLILLQINSEALLEMVYFNADGNEGSMCGNGGRCFVQFAKDLGLFADEVTFIATDGLHIAKIDLGLIHLKMMDVNKVQTIENDYFLNTGSPHFVRFVTNIEQYEVVTKGKQIRYSEAFAPKGTNVNFAEPIDGKLWVRTYERGVEDETYSCGTGVTAAAIVAESVGIKSPVDIMTLGGNLKVSYQKNADGNYSEVYLIGPAVKVFEGEVWKG